MPERFIGGLPVSERMWNLYQAKGGNIPGVGHVEIQSNEGQRTMEVQAPQAAETEEKKKEREQINQDLDLVLQRVPNEVRSNTEKYHEFKKNEKNAVDRLKEKGVDVDAYLREGSKIGTPEGNVEFGKRKGVLRKIVAKMRAGEDLVDEEQEIVDIVGLKKDTVMGAEEEIKKPEERKEAKGGETKKTEERKEDKGTERQPRKPSETEQKLANIAEYQSLVEQKAALERLRELLARKGAPKSEIDLVDKAMASLRVDEGKRIKEYKDKGEMRPELKEALDRYYEELEKMYDSSVNMVNIYQMSLYEGTLTRSLAEMKKIGVDGETLSEELSKELLDMGILHDLRLMINKQGSINESMLSYAAALKGEQFDRLIHLRNRQLKGENDFVTQYLVKIDNEARKAYLDPNGDKTKVFSLENPRLEGTVIRDQEKTKIDYLIARDLYRVTGGEARYGVMGYAHKDAGKGNFWVFEKNGDSNNGALFRKTLNKRRELYSAVDSTASGEYRLRYHEQLWSHLDPGVNSFWEKLWSEAKKAGGDENIFKTEAEIRMGADVNAGIPPREYAVLTTEALRKLSLGKERQGTVSISNEIDFNSWMILGR